MQMGCEGPAGRPLPEPAYVVTLCPASSTLLLPVGVLTAPAARSLQGGGACRCCWAVPLGKVSAVRSVGQQPGGRSRAPCGSCV